MISSRLITGIVTPPDYLLIKESILNSDSGSLLHNEVPKDAKILNEKIPQRFSLDRWPLILERRELD
jgi:hypothetical protein